MTSGTAAPVLTRAAHPPAASEDDVANFASITGADIEQARFFLESSEGNLEVGTRANLPWTQLIPPQLAVASFFDSGAGGAPGAGATPNAADFDDMDEEEDDDEDDLMLPGSLPTPAVAAVAAAPAGRTLSGAPVPAPSPAPAPRAAAPSGGHTLSGGAQPSSGSWNSTPSSRSVFLLPPSIPPSTTS